MGIFLLTLHTGNYLLTRDLYNYKTLNPDLRMGNQGHCAKGSLR